MKNGSIYCASGRTRCTPMQTAFPSVYQFSAAAAAAATFGASSATCEASFSTLTRVLTAYRRSMTHERKKNLIILTFLRSYTKNVKMEEVLRCFSKNSRKLQLFWLAVGYTSVCRSQNMTQKYRCRLHQCFCVICWLLHPEVLLDNACFGLNLWFVGLFH